jgi:hypothetical protein
MTIHKLANGPITITLSGIKSVEGNFGAQTQFSGVDLDGEPTDVYVSEMTAMRQLARLNLTPESAVGQTIRLEQVKKDGKTYTNIDIASADGSAPARPAAVAVAPAKKPELSELVALYGQCVKGAMETLGVACETAGVPFDASAIQAGAATLFIKATR